MAKKRGKSPTQKNKELLGGKNTLPTKDGVNEKTIKETVEQKRKELNKPFSEREGIKKTPVEKSSEPPKSKGWGGRSGRGGGFVPEPFQEMIDRKRVFPKKPLSENKENIIENEDKVNFANLGDEQHSRIEKDEKEKLMLAMKDFAIDKPSFSNKQPILENDIQNNAPAPENVIEEKERIMLAMKDIDKKRPIFLDKIELEPTVEIDVSAPSIDGDSDGGDGGE